MNDSMIFTLRSIYRSSPKLTYSAVRCTLGIELMVDYDNVTTRLIIPHTHRWRSQLASHSFISIRGSTMMPGRLMLQHEYSYLSLHHKPGPGVRGLRPAESESTLASSASWPAVASPCHLSHWGGNSAPASSAIRDQQTLSLLSSKYPEEWGALVHCENFIRTDAV